MGGGVAQLQRLRYIVGIGGEKQLRTQRAQITKRVAPLREYAALNGVQAVGFGRAKGAHAADRVVA